MRKRDVEPDHLLHRIEIHIVVLDQFHQTQTAHLRRGNAACLQDDGAREEESLEVVVSELARSHELLFGLDFPGDHPDTEFLVAPKQRFLIGGSRFLEIHAHDVHKWGEFRRALIVARGPVSQRVAPLPQCLAGVENRPVRLDSLENLDDHLLRGQYRSPVPEKKRAVEIDECRFVPEQPIEAETRGSRSRSPAKWRRHRPSNRGNWHGSTGKGVHILRCSSLGQGSADGRHRHPSIFTSLWQAGKGRCRALFSGRLLVSYRTRSPLFASFLVECGNKPSIPPSRHAGG